MVSPPLRTEINRFGGGQAAPYLAEMGWFVTHFVFLLKKKSYLTNSFFFFLDTSLEGILESSNLKNSHATHVIDFP